MRNAIVLFFNDSSNVKKLQILINIWVTPLTKNITQTLNILKVERDGVFILKFPNETRVRAYNECGKGSFINYVSEIYASNVA